MEKNCGRFQGIAKMPKFLKLENLEDRNAYVKDILGVIISCFFGSSWLPFLYGNRSDYHLQLLKKL